jgi:hypothetical protein
VLALVGSCRDAAAEEFFSAQSEVIRASEHLLEQDSSAVDFCAQGEWLSVPE